MSATAPFIPTEDVTTPLVTSRADIERIYRFAPHSVGSGHFGQVRIAQLRHGPEKKFAVKVVPKRKIRDQHFLL